MTGPHASVGHADRRRRAARRPRRADHRRLAVRHDRRARPARRRRRLGRRPRRCARAPGRPTCCGPGTLVERVHAVVLTGGSAYGLAAASGVADALGADGIGFRVGAEPGAVVPIVPAAVIYDLGRGGASTRRPGPAEGVAALRGASDRPGRAGMRRRRHRRAGRRAQGRRRIGQPGGAGHAGSVAALVVVNAAGSPVASGRPPLRRSRRARRRRWPHAPAVDPSALAAIQAAAIAAASNTVDRRGGDRRRRSPRRSASGSRWPAHDGIARAVRPSHLLVDGDVALQPGHRAGRSARTTGLINLLLAASADVVARAIGYGMLAATSTGLADLVPRPRRGGAACDATARTTSSRSSSRTRDRSATGSSPRCSAARRRRRRASSSSTAAGRRPVARGRAALPTRRLRPPDRRRGGDRRGPHGADQRDRPRVRPGRGRGLRVGRGRGGGRTSGFWREHVPGVAIDDTTVVVAERFRLVEQARSAGSRRARDAGRDAVRGTSDAADSLTTQFRPSRGARHHRLGTYDDEGRATRGPDGVPGEGPLRQARRAGAAGRRRRDRRGGARDRRAASAARSWSRRRSRPAAAARPAA